MTLRKFSKINFDFFLFMILIVIVIAAADCSVSSMKMTMMMTPDDQSCYSTIFESVRVGKSKR